MLKHFDSKDDKKLKGFMLRARSSDEDVVKHEGPALK